MGEYLLVVFFSLIALVFCFIVLHAVYLAMTDSSNNWRVYYHDPKHTSNSDIVIDGKKYLRSCLGTKSFAPNYLSIFCDAEFIRKDAGWFHRGTVIKSGSAKHNIGLMLARDY